MSDVESLRSTVARATGSRVTDAVAVAGGAAAQAGRFVLADGRTVFAKSVAGQPGMLAAEAASLLWLREGLASGPGPSAAADEATWPIRVPQVHAVVDDEHDPFDRPDPSVAPRPAAPVRIQAPRSGEAGLLVLDFVASAPGPADGELLGRGLAALHRSGAPRFGLGRTTWCGPLPQDNRPADDWAEFYAERRLLPLARAAVDSGHLDPATGRAVARVAARLDQLAGPAEPPARLHGDLWSGNVVNALDGRPWLVDPAAHAGHREVDLAMLRLFGGVDERTFGAYDDAHPLADGWSERVRLWQLAPLLVHTILFAGPYAAAVRSTADAYT